MPSDRRVQHRRRGAGADARAAEAPARSPRRSAAILLRAYRPRQWSKNLLVLAAPAAARDRPAARDGAGRGDVPRAVPLSSATYLFNDVRDREHDRLDPRKRLRPIAAGELSPRTRSRSPRRRRSPDSRSRARDREGRRDRVCYLALTVSYSLWWRRVVVLDILVIAAGFVLRALAGGVATDIYLSRWFVIVTASARCSSSPPSATPSCASTPARSRRARQTPRTTR